jgi:chromate reductase
VAARGARAAGGGASCRLRQRRIARSRPYGKSAWGGKPGAVVSASPGSIGGFGANYHLRQSLVYLNIPAMAQPEAYLGGADKLFDERGKLANAGTRKFLQDFMQAFEAWITANIK